MSGYERRPIWNDPRTTKVAAINTWKAKQEQCQREGHINLAHRRNRRFADDWHVSIKGYQTTTSLDNRKRQRAQSTDATDGEPPPPQGETKRKTRQMTRSSPTSNNAHNNQDENHKGQRNPKRKQPTDLETREQEECDIDPHIPLPTMTKDQKAQKGPTEDNEWETIREICHGQEAENLGAKSSSSNAPSPPKNEGDEGVNNGIIRISQKRKAAQQLHPPKKQPQETESKEKSKKSTQQDGSPTRTKPQKRKANNQLGPEAGSRKSCMHDTKQQQVDKGASSFGSEPTCYIAIANSGEEFQSASRGPNGCKQSSAPKCFSCNYRMKRAGEARICPPGPRWMGFQPGLPICDICNRALLKNLRQYKPFGEA